MGNLPSRLEVMQVLYLFVPAYLANMTPVLVKGILPALAGPIDGGRTWRGRRIFGDHKTWRGLLAGTVAGVAAFQIQVILYRAGFLQALAVLDYPSAGWWPGVLLGVGTGVGDALKSFFKRQIGIPPGASWLGPDQLDFMVGAYAFLCVVYVPPLVPTLACLPVVLLGDVAFSAFGFSLGLKEAWI
jgi:CDP-2,3-bis-(O-geranylgeranyl)-sn-glycerol synthase